MTIDEQEEKPIGPRLAAAVFFSIYALCFLIFAKYTLLSITDSLKLPLFPSVFLVLFTGAYLGGLFGTVLAKSRFWYHSLIIGCIMAVLAILLISLAVMIHAWFFDSAFFARLHNWRDYFVIYGMLVLSISLIVGLWLVPLTGLAAIYFNKQFLPGLLAVDQQRIEENKRQRDQSDD